jgi:hypothetical protein
MRLLAIDPGSTHSAYVVVDDDLEPIWFDKIPNEELLKLPHLYTCDRVAIEQIGHYGTGMPAGQTVFDTCVWIGRFWQAILEHDDSSQYGDPPKIVHLIPRREVKLHLCGQTKANDGNIRQALIDRFASEQRNSGKGVKNEPGFFYGFHSDIWQAMGLAVYWMDTQKANVT